MADDVVQVAPDSTGKKIDNSSLTVGANTVYRQRTNISDPTTAAAIASVLNAAPGGTEYALVVRAAGDVSIVGKTQTAASGTITTSSSVVGGATDYGTAGNVTVTFTGTYAGVNATFQVSPDAGTTWYATQGQRIDSGVAESTTGVLPANTTRAWNFSMLGYNRFRVLATAYTSGTASVSIIPGTMPFVPVVSAVANSVTRVPVLLTFNSSAPVVAETLVSTVKTTGGSAAAGATSIAPTTGKTLRITSITATLRATAATLPFGTIRIRSNAAGATLVGSNMLVTFDFGGTAAAIGNVGMIVVPVPDGSMDISGAATLGITFANNVTTNVVAINVFGYEF